MESILADLRVSTKADMETIVENRFTKRNNTLQLRTVNCFKFTSGDVLEASYISSNNCLKYSMFQVVEQALDPVVWSGLVLQKNV